MAERSLHGQIEFHLTAVSESEAAGEMPVQPGIVGPFGSIPAGALVWFAELVAASLVLGGEEVAEGTDNVPVAVSLDVHLLAQCDKGVLVARAVWLRRRPVAQVRTEVRGPDRSLLLELTSTYPATAATCRG